MRSLARARFGNATLLALAASLPCTRTVAQVTRPTGLEVGALPAVNFDSDEGVGYGAIAELYHYGDGTRPPWVWMVQPKVFLTTGGRRDFTVFFDAPHLLPGGWRLGAWLGSEEQIATPYYGLGNETAYDENLDDEDGPDPYYYRFGRTRRSVSTSLQHGFLDPRLRVLVGAGVARVSVVPVPKDKGTTLFAAHWGEAERVEWHNYVRAGLVWDTRDRETGPTRGTWTEILVQRVDRALGSEATYTRWTFADRRYVSLTPTLTFAHRYLVQDVRGAAPVSELFRVQTSFKQQEGLGGASTVRGVLKNRWVGRGMLIWNAELRWRAAAFRMWGRPFHTVLSVFLDQGRVWEGDVRMDELFADLHRGVGGGVRLGMGEDFVVAFDAGTSNETGLPVYIGLGYLY